MTSDHPRTSVPGIAKLMRNLDLPLPGPPLTAGLTPFGPPRSDQPPCKCPETGCSAAGQQQIRCRGRNIAALRLKRLLRRHGFAGPLIPRFTRLRATQTLAAPKPLPDYGGWPRARGSPSRDAPTACVALWNATPISTTGISPRSTVPDSRTSMRRVGGAGGRLDGGGPTKARAGG